jgi:MFS family permease
VIVEVPEKRTMTPGVCAAGEAPARTGIARLPFYYGWVNLVVASLAMTATLPGRTHGLGLITKPLLDDLHIDDVLYGTLNFWAILLGAAFCWPVGRLLDRFGARGLLVAVAVALGLVVLLMSRVREVVALFVTLTLVRGLGQGALSVVSMAIIGKWFTRRLGLAMGVFSVLLAVGFIAATLGVGAAVLTAGWRSAWAGIGLALLAGLAPLGWLLVRNTPEAHGLAPDRASRLPAARPPARVDFTLAAALRTPAFWVFSLATSLYGLMWSAITLFNQAILEDHCFDAMTFYLVMAVLTASGLVANLFGGWLATRWSMGRLLAVGMALLALAFLAFPGIRTVPQVLAYGVVLGAAGGLIVVVFFAVYGHAFGRTHLGQIQGAAQVLSVFASALGPLLMALCKEWTGSYDLMFQGAAPAVALLGLCAWGVALPEANPAASSK